MSTQVASLHATLKLDNRDFNRGMQQAERSMSSFGGRMRSAGAEVTKFGGMMTLGVTTPILAAGAAAVKTGIELESAFTGVIKTVDATDAQIATLRGQLEGMATDIDSPVAALDNAHVSLFEIAEAAGQLGVAVEDIDEFTETVAMLAMTTDIVGQEGAMSLAQFTNVTGFPTSDVRRLGDVIADLGNNSATTESQILELGKRIATLSDVGFDEDELLGYAAALSSAGISAELGGTNFIKGVNEMVLGAAVGGPALDQFADVAGMTSESFQELAQNNPSAALQEFLAGLGEMDRAAQVTVLDDLNIKGQEAQRVFLTLAGNTDLLSNSLGIANEAFAGNGALMAEAQTRAQTTAGQINVFKNNVVQLGSAFADMLLPTINQFLPVATAFISRLSELNPQTMALILGSLGLAAAMGPVITAVGMLATGVGILLSPIGLLAVAIGAVVFAAHKLYPGGLPALFADASASAQMLAAIGMAALQRAAYETQRAISAMLNTINSAISKIDDLKNRLSSLSNVGGMGGEILRNSGNSNFWQVARNAFADGGNPPIGQAALVGERGPEIIVPRSATTVIPNEQSQNMMGGGGDITVNINNPRIMSGQEKEAEMLGYSIAEGARRQAGLNQVS